MNYKKADYPLCHWSYKAGVKAGLRHYYVYYINSGSKFGEVNRISIMASSHQQAKAIIKTEISPEYIICADEIEIEFLAA